MLRKRKVLGREALGLLQYGFTYEAIGSFFGLSRQRIQQALSPTPYVRRTLLRRAGGYCEVCQTNVGTSGHVHHISNQGDAYNSIVNLRLLCASCHSIEHFSSLPKLQKKEKPQKPLRPTPTMKASDVREIMKKLNMGPTAFAKHLLVSQAAVSYWIHNKRKIPPAMAKHIQRTADELMENKTICSTEEVSE